MIKPKNKNISIFNSDDFYFYYGIPNSYSNFSIGKSNPYDAFRISYNNKLDFLFLTDLNDSLKSKIKYNKSKKYKWNILNELSKKFSKKRENFIALTGFQVKSNSIGDFSVINSKNYFTGELDNIEILFFWLLKNEKSFFILTNPNKNILNLKYNKIIDNLLSSFPVGSGTFPKYTRREKLYYNLLDKGWTLGAINSQCNIKDDFGNYDNLTCLVVNKFHKEKISTSFINRRTFSTESSTLKLFFNSNDYFMGDIITERNLTQLEFNIFCEDKINVIKKIQIISNNGIIIKDIEDLNLHKVKYLYTHTLEKNQTWFLIKVYQNENKIAISSPIFIKEKN